MRDDFPRSAAPRTSRSSRCGAARRAGRPRRRVASGRRAITCRRGPSSWILRVIVLRPMPSLCAASMRAAARDLERRADQLRLELARQRVPDHRLAGVQQLRARAARAPPSQPGDRDGGVGRSGRRRRRRAAADSRGDGARRRSAAAAPALAAVRACRPARRRARSRLQLRRQVLGLDQLRRRHHGQPVADVLELAHVAGEVEAGPARASAASEMRLGSTPSSRALFCRKWRASGGMSSRALAQRRQAQADHVEAVEQVLAERARARRAARGPGASRR